MAHLDSTCQNTYRTCSELCRSGQYLLFLRNAPLEVSTTGHPPEHYLSGMGSGLAIAGDPLRPKVCGMVTRYL